MFAICNKTQSLPPYFLIIFLEVESWTLFVSLCVNAIPPHIIHQAHNTSGDQMVEHLSHPQNYRPNNQAPARSF